MERNLVSILILVSLGLLVACQAEEPETPVVDDARTKLISRGKALELDTEYVPPPGDPLSHSASGFAKVLCSALFITGLDLETAKTSIGYFTSPPQERDQFQVEVDHEIRAVHVTLPDGTVRTARLWGGQGCVALPEGTNEPLYQAVEVVANLPDPTTTPWPMGDVLPAEPLPGELDQEKVTAAVDAAFEPPESLTGAFVVTHRGRIIGERYMEGKNKNTMFESWSMGKSLTATFMGILIEQGIYDLWQPAPIPEWQGEGDPRASIRIADIMRMSSGLRFRAPQDPDFDPSVGYADHIYVYTGTIDAFHWSATRPQQWEPNTVGRYRNCDPALINYLVRLAVEARGEDYHTFPQRQLFAKLGIRDMVLETDPYGNFLIQGYEFGSGRAWARLGNLYLQDGVWNDERILPEGFAEFVSTLAPAWEADGRPIYGGFFWINGEGRFPVPRDAYFMAGAGGQYTIIIPSHDLVVVRLGLYKGSGPGGEALNRALALLMEAVPSVR
jgi:CubicO group peptidase (beta-lactamase class C family)